MLCTKTLILCSCEISLLCINELKFLGEHLRICERGLTCCTEEMEHKLSTHSRAEFDKLLHSAISELKDIFESHTHKFDGKFNL